MFDRDTAPGTEAGDLMRLDAPALIVPGKDASHATSVARYLEECLPRADCWDMPVAEQTENSVTRRVLQTRAKILAERGQPKARFTAARRLRAPPGPPSPP